MKAPDRIYLPENLSNSDKVRLSSVDEKGRGIEYIRKNALVTAIEKQIKFYENSHPVNDYEKGSDAGAVAALKHILESL